MNKQLFRYLSKGLFSNAWVMKQSSQLIYSHVKSPARLEFRRLDLYCFKARKFSADEEKQITCWNCKSVLKRSDLFCANCQHLQEPSEKLNYFELFNHPTQFDVEMSELANYYRELQTHLHPDKFTGMTAKQQKLSEQYSALVNKAYKTLSNRMERGLYLLELYGKPLLENTVEMEPDFLVNIMEINERVHAVNDVRALEELGVTNMITINALFKQVAKAFQESDTEKARHLLARLKYYYSIDEQILKAEERLRLC